jgi:putative transcriptional regulator
MLRNRDKKSKILDMVEEELHAINEIKDASVSIREFNKTKYFEPKHYTSKDVVRIRKKLHVSQAVFAYLLNASESTVKKWEIGAKEPGGANCRLLQMIENMGIGILCKSGVRVG